MAIISIQVRIQFKSFNFHFSSIGSLCCVQKQLEITNEVLNIIFLNSCLVRVCLVYLILRLLAVLVCPQRQQSQTVLEDRAREKMTHYLISLPRFCVMVRWNCSSSIYISKLVECIDDMPVEWAFGVIIGIVVFTTEYSFYKILLQKTFPFLEPHHLSHCASKLFNQSGL